MHVRPPDHGLPSRRALPYHAHVRTGGFQLRYAAVSGQLKLAGGEYGASQQPMLRTIHPRGNVRRRTNRRMERLCASQKCSAYKTNAVRTWVHDCTVIRASIQHARAYLHDGKQLPLAWPFQCANVRGHTLYLRVDALWKAHRRPGGAAAGLGFRGCRILRLSGS